MLTYQHTPECLGYMVARLSEITEAPRLKRAPCGYPLRERLEFVITSCRELLDYEVVRDVQLPSKSYKQEVLDRQIVSAATLLLAVLLDQRRIATTFEGGFPSMYEPWWFSCLLKDLRAFAEIGGWFKEVEMADVLQARLEIAIRTACCIKGKLEQKVAKEARLELQGLFEGMLRQVFILLIHPSVAALLERAG